MKKAITIILVLLLAALIAGAGWMYKDLRDQVQAQQLATQGHRDTKPRETEPEDTAPENTEPAKQLAPDFTVVDPEGNVCQLSQFRGTPVVLNFWASWCGPCKSEMPTFEAKAAELQGKVQFMMVNLTDGETETPETAHAFIQEMGYTFPVFYDTYQNAMTAYGVNAVPVTYFIDAEGYLVAYGSGAIDETTLQRGIDMICE